MSSDAEKFGIGLLVGVVLGLLFAPRPGKETRAILGKGFEAFKERALEVMEEVGEKSVEAVKRSADAVERSAERVRAKSAEAETRIKEDKFAREIKSS